MISSTNYLVSVLSTEVVGKRKNTYNKLAFQDCFNFWLGQKVYMTMEDVFQGCRYNLGTYSLQTDNKVLNWVLNGYMVNWLKAYQNGQMDIQLILLYDIFYKFNQEHWRDNFRKRGCKQVVYRNESADSVLWFNYIIQCRVDKDIILQKGYFLSATKKLQLKKIKN
eukprot:TRINITY_DN4921_c0_g1_i2.p2 TRINITY_DN4921_c0_g1~~TRINITY_DN4921_c0_g1_i2.p2  ORF type:complete len:166 (+),score=0.59 TRINITY_DN4921_c0_g1_i2:244-741(+)